jgi:hypothetical protein
MDATFFFQAGFILVGFLVLSRILSVTLSNAVALVFASVAIYSLYIRKTEETLNFNETLDYKLKEIKNVCLDIRIKRRQRRNLLYGARDIDTSPEYFYLEPDFILFMHNILFVAEYDPDNFERLVYTIDQVIRLAQDVDKGVSECSHNISTMDIFRTEALNTYASFIHVLPVMRKLDKRHLREQRRLALLLQRLVDTSARQCEARVGADKPNVDTRFVRADHLYGGPKPVDPNSERMLLYV